MAGRATPWCDGSNMPAPWGKRAVCNDCGQTVVTIWGVFAEHWWPGQMLRHGPYKMTNRRPNAE